ncbi:FecR family protein [Mucilaginibacter flavus]|uniref:FecR family protein n=1 Tax=Mucilaginibacter flavus TaxID=931504 RepID=UPI0025B37FDA|nr:FecR family protein [Mucilaginibacter flavus]MDN3580850.1 FecR domain-containing protein [Mucilaginibacter flavus]
MENNAYDPKELAHKLEQGSITARELAWFEQWYAGFNDEEVLLSAAVHSSADELRNSIFNRIAAQMEAPVQPKRKVITLWRGIAAAAAVIALICFAAFYRDSVLNVIDPVKQLELNSAAGQHRHFVLPDGTQVWLSPSTRISYPDNFRGEQRLVTLTGEAFFDVKHDATHPFIIQSGAIKTAVLGTSFNVNAYADAPVTEVTVVTGKVAVAADKNRQIMTPNQRVVFNKTNGLLVKQDFPDAARFLDQRNGLFNFNGQPVQNVADNLARQYGIRITVDAALAQKGFYGHLNTNQPAAQTFNKLSAVMDAQWHKANNQYYLEPIAAKN